MGGAGKDDLARLSGRTSALGHRFDLCSDYSANILVFVGMGFGLQDGPLGAAAIALGALAGSAIGVIFWLVRYVERTDGVPLFVEELTRAVLEAGGRFLLLVNHPIFQGPGSGLVGAPWARTTLVRRAQSTVSCDRL